MKQKKGKQIQYSWEFLQNKKICDMMIANSNIMARVRSRGVCPQDKNQLEFLF